MATGYNGISDWNDISQDEATRRLRMAPVPEGVAAESSMGGPTPSGAGSRFSMMDVPEGASIRRTLTSTGEDGARESVVASWVHSPVRPAEMPGPGKFERLDMQRNSMGGSNEARARRLEDTRNLRMMDANRMDRVAKEDADRMNAQTLEAIKAFGEVGGKEAVAAGMRGQGAEAAGLTAQADAATRAQDAFFKGLDYQGRQRDDVRADEQLGLNREQFGLQKEQETRRQEWDAEVRKRSAADIEAGKASGQPFETYFDPQSKRQFFRSWGDVDPKTGEKSGWKPVTTDMFGSLGGAVAGGVAGTTEGAPVAGMQQKTVVFTGRSQGGRNYRRYSDGTVEWF